MYKCNDFASNTILVLIELTASHQTKVGAISHVWYIILIQIKLSGESIIIGASVCVLQRDPYNELAIFFTSLLLQYSDLVDYSGLENETTAPIGLVRDYNLSEDNREKIERNSA